MLISKESRIKRIYNCVLELICELIANELSLQRQNEHKRRVESFNSLDQTKFEKTVLNSNLVLIIIISIGLFLFFSIPPKYIFRNI